jgi:hypothetical protein
MRDLLRFLFSFSKPLVNSSVQEPSQAHQ